MPELNQEILRKRLIEIYKEYVKSSSTSTTKIKEIVKEYDEIRELLDETLNMAIGILEALSKNEIKDKKEKDQLIKQITKELNSKSYLLN
jgi:hypothetical protein